MFLMWVNQTVRTVLFTHSSITSTTGRPGAGPRLSWTRLQSWRTLGDCGRNQKQLMAKMMIPRKKTIGEP